MHVVTDEHDVAKRSPFGIRSIGVLCRDQFAAVNLVVVCVFPSGPTQRNRCPGWRFPHT
jgi:hypothetical protein